MDRMNPAVYMAQLPDQILGSKLVNIQQGWYCFKGTAQSPDRKSWTI
jgi:hypothetical protein